MNIDVSEKGLNELIEALENAADNIPKELFAALGKAAQPARRAMTNEVVSELNVPKKVPNKQIKIHKDKDNLVVTISLPKTFRIPLKEFKPTVSKRNGVGAKISKTKGKKSYPNAFRVNSIGGHIFTRSQKQAPRVMTKGSYKGQIRQPLAKLRGPSPWGGLAKNPEKLSNLVQVSREEVLAAIKDRVRYLELKKRGGLNWQQNETTETETEG